MVEYRSSPPAIQEKPAAKIFAKSAPCMYERERESERKSGRGGGGDREGGGRGRGREGDRWRTSNKDPLSEERTRSGRQRRGKDRSIEGSGARQTQTDRHMKSCPSH